MKAKSFDLHFPGRHPDRIAGDRQSRIQVMIDKGMDNEKQVLQGLIDQADNRIAEISSG